MYFLLMPMEFSALSRLVPTVSTGSQYWFSWFWLPPVLENLLCLIRLRILSHLPFSSIIKLVVIFFTVWLIVTNYGSLWARAMEGGATVQIILSLVPMLLVMIFLVWFNCYFLIFHREGLFYQWVVFWLQNGEFPSLHLISSFLSWFES